MSICWRYCQSHCSPLCSCMSSLVWLLSPHALRIYSACPPPPTAFPSPITNLPHVCYTRLLRLPPRVLFLSPDCLPPIPGLFSSWPSLILFCSSLSSRWSSVCSPPASASLPPASASTPLASVYPPLAPLQIYSVNKVDGCCGGRSTSLRHGQSSIRRVMKTTAPVESELELQCSLITVLWTA